MSKKQDEIEYEQELEELKKQIISSLLATIAVARQTIKDIADSKHRLNVLIKLEVTTRYLESLVKYFKSIHGKYLTAPTFPIERQEDSQQ